MLAAPPGMCRAQFRKSLPLWNGPFTTSPRLASLPGATANIPADGGSQPDRQAPRLSPALQERIPQFLLPSAPRGASDRIHPRDRRGRVDRGRQELLGLAADRALAG